jgi:hypothetical protein
MLRTESRFDPKKKRVDHKKTQFVAAQYQENNYSHRLSFYDVPPTQEISLEEFETWAIDRLRSKYVHLSFQHHTERAQFWLK